MGKAIGRLIKHNGPRGFVVYMLLGLTAVIYLVFFSYQSMVMNSMDKAHYTMALQSVRNVAFSVVNAIYPYLAYKCRIDPTSPLAQFVSGTSDTDFYIDPASDQVLVSLFREFAPAVVENIHLKAVTREDLSAAAGPAGEQDPDTYSDPLEKKIIVEIGCTIKFEKLRYECRIKRRITKLLSTVPVYSKFSLMIRNKTSEPSIYNLFLNTIAGLADRQNLFQPIRIYNHNVSEDLTSSDFSLGRKIYQQRGYIYFGSETVLNKTAGFHRDFGEMFHFVKVDQSIGILRCYSTMNGALPFVPPNPPGGYAVEYTPLGYYADMFTDPSAPNVMKLYMGLAPFSSTLHLFGDQTTPSPTLVLGRVYQSYPVYKCLTNDLDQNGGISSTPDLEYTMVNALEQKNDFFTYTDLSGFPVNFSQSSGNIHNSWRDYCANSYANYAKMMSIVVKEPYNRAYNYMLYLGFLSNELQPTITNSLSEAELDASMNDLANFKLVKRNADGTETKLITGDPGQINVTNILKGRVQKRYKDQADFFKECYRNRKLAIPYCVVAVERGPITLPDDLEVEEGGIVVLESGDFETHGIKASKVQILSLYASTGNIKVESQHKYRYVSLNAPEGFIRNTSAEYPLDLVGNVVCRLFDHTSFASGGKIQYSHYLDPMNDKFSAARYKLILNPSILTLEYTRK